VADHPADPPASRPPLDPARLVTPVDWSVEVVETAPSTNVQVAERARSGAAGEGLVIVAEHQTAGRGRLDRTWETPARSAVTMSLLLVPRASAADWPWLPLLTGYAVARALRQLGAAVSLKWPNDVLLGDRKLAGILTERVDTPTGPAVVAGVGVNVDLTREELPHDGATSLSLEGVAVDRTDLLSALLRSLRTEYDAFQRGELAALRSAYATSCATLGREVRVALPNGDTLAGEATGIDEGGRLLVSGPGGVVPVSAGDVVHATIT
jgi:BirA family transcriptional regulator, biotin operon repressor / biotin---[acetyl-CoA-carboxylase] ligase